MRLFGWFIAICAAIAFGFSFMAETRFAPLVGAVLLLGSILYATWITQTDRANFLRAERATRRRREERARENARQEAVRASGSG